MFILMVRMNILMGIGGSNRCPLGTVSLGPRCRGAEWVQSAIHNSTGDPSSTPAPAVGLLQGALAMLPLPAELTLEAVGPSENDASDDTIRAVNLGNHIAPRDLSDEVWAALMPQ